MDRGGTRPFEHVGEDGYGEIRRCGRRMRRRYPTSDRRANIPNVHLPLPAIVVHL
jgi:hypothetical protein